jgi:1,3-propanediol dehydrogenase/alcohol dehydrogenase
MEVNKMVANFLTTPKIIYGTNSIDNLSEHLKLLGQKPLLVIGSGSVKRNGTYERITEQIPYDYVVFENVYSDPDVESVEAGVKEYGINKCDYVIAVGGGSVLDAAKAIALLVSNGGKITDYEFSAPKQKCPPIVAIPTTAGTGSEVTKFTIITDNQTKKKMAIGHEYMMPTIAVLDPTLTLTTPACVTAATGMDALTHAIEAYISDKRNFISDIFALKAIKLITQNIQIATYNPTNLLARENMLYGQMLAGLAFNNSSVALVHAMSRPLGAYYGIAHGEANAMLLTTVLEFNKVVCFERYKEIAEYLNIPIQNKTDYEIADEFVSYITNIYESLPLRKKLTEFGVKEKDIPLMANTAYENGSAKVNPRKPLYDEVVNIYKTIH